MKETGELIGGGGLVYHQDTDIWAIEGIFAAENHKSQRVMEKLGMTYVEDTEYEKFDGSAHFLAKKYQRVWE